MYVQNEGVSCHETLQLFSFLFPLQHVKRPALQNKRVGVLRMAFRARKVFGSFEKRKPGLQEILKQFFGVLTSFLRIELNECLRFEFNL